jgi:hypothetical protein
MKWLSGFSFLIALGFILNAIEGNWAVKPELSGTKYVWFDIGLAIAFLVASYLLYVIDLHQDQRRMLAEYERSTGASAAPRETRRPGVDAPQLPTTANAPSPDGGNLPRWTSADNPPGWYAHPEQGDPQNWDGSAFHESE